MLEWLADQMVKTEMTSIAKAYLKRQEHIVLPEKFFTTIELAMLSKIQEFRSEQAV